MMRSPRPSWWAGRSTLVTGCTGFVGCAVCRQVGDLGARIVGVARAPVGDDHPFARFGLLERVKLVAASVDDLERLTRLIEEERIEVVFHLAGESRLTGAAGDVHAAFEANVRGTWNVLEAVRRAGGQAHVVIASSATVYGTAVSGPCSESMPLRGTSPYDASKMCAEIVARTYHEAHAIPVCVVRCGNVFGGGDVNLDRLVPGAIHALLAGERPVIRSDGRTERDFLYIDDAARGYVMLAQAADQPGIAGETFNLARGRSTSLVEVVQAAARLAGRTDLAPMVLGARAGAASVVALSPLKAQEMVGWVPEVGLEDGLARTIAWYRDARRTGTRTDLRAAALGPR